MRYIFVIISFWILTPGNGFGHKAFMEVSRNGKEIKLKQKNGEKIDSLFPDKFKVLEAFAYSTNNANDSFYVCAHLEKVLVPENFSLYLLLKSSIELRSGWSTTDGKIDLIEFEDLSFELAKILVDLFKIKIKLRSDPNNKIFSLFTTTKKIYKRGDSVWVSLMIKNEGDIAFDFFRIYQEEGDEYKRCRRFWFELSFNGKRIKNKFSWFLNGDPRGWWFTLNPGDSVKIFENVSRWHSFDSAGFYKVRCAFNLDLIRPGRVLKKKWWYHEFGYEKWDAEIRQEIEVEVH